ncbi:hypothetical protein MRB53_039358 [Persea americana]|nr:hypothetical protein MRB53_039358 [Persea americana]
MIVLDCECCKINHTYMYINSLELCHGSWLVILWNHSTSWLCSSIDAAEAMISKLDCDMLLSKSSSQLAHFVSSTQDALRTSKQRPRSHFEITSYYDRVGARPRDRLSKMSS